MPTEEIEDRSLYLSNPSNLPRDILMNVEFFNIPFRNDNGANISRQGNFVRMKERCRKVGAVAIHLERLKLSMRFLPSGKLGRVSLNIIHPTIFKIHLHHIRDPVFAVGMSRGTRARARGKFESISRVNFRRLTATDRLEIFAAIQRVMNHSVMRASIARPLTEIHRERSVPR